jgi:hypothetical protein
MQISANTAQLATAVQDVNKRLDDMAGAGKKAAKDLSVLKNIEIAKVFVEGIKLVADGLVSAANAATTLFNDSREAIDAIGKLSTQTGVSVESIQKLQGVARLAGVESETLAKALGKLGVQADKLKDKDDNVFERLGLDAQELASSDVETILFKVADAFANISGDTEKLGIASELFGERIGRSLVPLLNQGGAALEQALDRAGRLGGVLTEEQVRLVERMNDRFAEVSSTIAGIINQVTAGLAGPLENIAQQLLDVFERFGGASIGKFIADSILSFADGFIAAIQSLVETVQIIGEGIKSILAKLGIDVRSEEERQLAALERRSRVAESLEEGRGSARSRASNRSQLAALGGALSNEEQAQLERLQAKFNSQGNAIQDSLASVRDSIQQGRSLIDESFKESAVVEEAGELADATSRVAAAQQAAAEAADSFARSAEALNATLANPGAAVDVDVATDSAVEGIDSLQESTDEQTAELRGLRSDIRNGQAQVVEIPG